MRPPLDSRPGVDETMSERGDIKADKLILTYAINKPILRL